MDPRAKNWLFEINESLSHDKFTKLAVTLWSIWYARRKAIHEAIFQSPHQTISFVNSCINEIEQLPRGDEHPRMTTQVDNQQRWLPPPANIMKLNVDVAIARHKHGGMATAVCCDHNGVYLG